MLGRTSVFGKYTCTYRNFTKHQDALKYKNRLRMMIQPLIAAIIVVSQCLSLIAARIDLSVLFQDCCKSVKTFLDVHINHEIVMMNN